MDNGNCVSVGDHNTTPSPNSITSVTSPTPTITLTPMGLPKKKSISIASEHFTKLEGANSSDPQVQCNHCGVVYGYYYKRHGTSLMKNHLEEQYKKSLI